MSARTWTVVPCVEELFAPLGSVVEEATLAVFERSEVREETTCTTSVTVAVAPFAMSPIEHVTTPAACPHEPTEGVAETKVVPAGTVSVTTVLVAVEGPPLWTVSV
jgi:hypothetical protein